MEEIKQIKSRLIRFTPSLNFWECFTSFTGAEQEGSRFRQCAKRARIFNPLAAFGTPWRGFQRVPEGSRGSYRQFWSTYISVIQDVCSFGGQKHILIKIRHFSFFSLGPEGSRNPLTQSPTVALRAFHGTLKPSHIRPAHLCIHSTRNKKMYVIFSHQFLFLMSLMNIL